MEKISNYINLLFQKLFDSNKHPFYQDFDKVNKITKLHNKSKDKYIKSKIDYNPNIKIPDHLILEINKKQKTFEIETLKNLSDEIDVGSNFEKILKLVNILYTQNIPANNSFEENIYENIQMYRNSQRINVAIIGAGPVGLFLACYLHKYYNSNYGLNDQPRVNIIIFENRIVNSGLKCHILEEETFHSPLVSFNI